jgi:uncharacterized protein involved in exopolysaccharide biosynthesis
VQQLSTDLARQRAQLAELSSRLGANHPQVQAAQQQIDELSRRLGDEAQRVASSVELSARSANSSDRAVQQLLGQQRARVMALKQARDQLNLLQQDVDRARRNHDLALQSHHAAASRNDAQVSDARMLAAASAPLDPTRPPLLLALVFALASGALLGGGAAFIAEQRRPLMRIDQDLTELLGLDILAEVPRLAFAGNSRWDGWTRWSRGLRHTGVQLP